MPGPTVTALHLSPEQLTRTFNKPFSFATTAELQPLQGVLGQARAVQALQFGVSMPRAGYNVFVMGESGTGRFSYVRRYLNEQAKQRPTPSDWLYVNHFDEMR
ncbi:MAG TPA: AAA family ATPase, partial [Pseudomonas sp.]|nr:AAA family ATPase [Pseudomonas sp.]